MTASDQATAYERSWSGTADCVHFWREPRYGDMECLTARYRDHHYVPHVHETYAIGVIIEGAEAWHYRGARHVAGPGEIVSVMPGELHDGEAEDQLFAYRMLYPSVAQVRRALAEAGLPNPPLPTIPETKIEDRELASTLVRLHSLLERGAPRLSVDQLFLEALARLFARHGERPSEPAGPPRAPAAMAGVRDYLEAHLDEDLSLDELAGVAGLDRFALARAFRRAYGVPPYAYLTSRRIAAAKRELAGAEPLAEVALACGFYDQSHFSRTFKAWTGVTPGQYRAASRL